MIKKLKGLEGKPYGECLAEYFKGEEVELYFGESSGTTYYADYDVDQKVCLTGKIIGAVGEMVIVEAKVKDDFPTREVAIHAWAIVGCSKTDKGKKIKLSHIFREMKR